MAVEHIRLSQQARDQLIALKRYTKIRNWNVLCRWGFCLSLAEPTKPQEVRITMDSSVEMTWKVFGGKYDSAYLALLKMRMVKDGMSLTDEMVASQFRLHLHRGISYLAADRSIRSISGMVKKAFPQAE